VRLKTELHQIIGLCAALAFLVTGLLAFWSVRRFHRVEYVEARGALLGRVLRTACVEKIGGPSPVPDLTRFLSHLVRPGSADDEDLDIVSAVVYDPDRQVVVNLGATSRAHDPADPHVVRAYASSDPEGVEIEAGEVFDRWSKDGEEIVEFALPLVSDSGEHQGVLVFALVRRGAREAFFRTVVIMFVGGALVIALLWLVLFKMLKGRILAPILLLSKGIERVRAGDLTARVQIHRRDEIGTLVESFNDLIAVLVERDSLQARLEEANRLEEAHRKLNEAHRQLQQAQEQLIITEKHASIGRLVHGLNHELNNPLSAARNMLPPLRKSLDELRSVHAPAAELAEAADEAPEEHPAPPAPDEVGGEPEAPPQAEAEAVEGSGSGSSRRRSVSEEASALAPGPRFDPAEVKETLEDATRAVEVLERSVRRAINIVHDLGAFSRLTTADLERIPLREVIAEAIAACESDLGERIPVSVDLPEVDGEPLTLKAFPNLLTQVFVNLLTNSAQAIEGNGRVRIAAKLVGDDRVRIEYDDNGPGIPKENLSKVFEPFFTTKEQGQGTGLGLSLCLGIVQKHGGTMGVKKRWRGAHFVVELPLEAILDTTDPFGSAAFLSAGTTTVYQG
jgi:signal transduction histidine kinase